MQNNATNIEKYKHKIKNTNAPTRAQLPNHTPHYAILTPNPVSAKAPKQTPPSKHVGFGGVGVFGRVSGKMKHLSFICSVNHISDLLRGVLM